MNKPIHLDNVGGKSKAADGLTPAQREELERAVESWETIIREDPENEWARAELKKLYHKSAKWNALNDMLKGEIDSLPEDAWEERKELYKKLLELNKNHLGADEMVLNHYNRAIFALDPSDVSAQVAFEKICREEGRWSDLAKILSQKIDKSTDSKSKVSLLFEMAELWMNRLRDLSGAIGSFEEILRIEPKNERARESLKALYRKQKSWRPLLRLLEREAENLEGQVRLELLLEIEQVVSKSLKDADRSIGLWQRVLEIDPRHPQALNAIEQYALKNKDWIGYSKIIETRIAGATSEKERIDLLYKLGAVYANRIEDHGRAAEVWQRVLCVNPDDSRAHRSLKESYMASENWESLENLYTDEYDYMGIS